MAVETKKIEMLKNTDVVPALEVSCPFCKHTFEVEMELVDTCSNIFCSYCSQKVEL